MSFIKKTEGKADQTSSSCCGVQTQEVAKSQVDSCCGVTESDSSCCGTSNKEQVSCC
jgi:hypothetical protein